MKAKDPIALARLLAEGSDEAAQMARAMLDLLQKQHVLEQRCQALEQAMQQSQRSLRAIDYSFIGILETDGDWHILRANRACSSITGLEPRALSSLALPELTSGAGLSKAQRHLADLRELGIAQSEWSMIRQDGQAIIMTVGSVQIDESRYIHFIDDVTEQRHASKAIVEARLSAEAADRAKSEFLANISHEVRTPLNGIIGLSQLALTSAPDRKQEYLRLILRSGHTLLQIINDLLDYAKIEAGKLEFEQVGFSMVDLLDDLAGQAGISTAEKRLGIAFILHRDVPEYLIGDKLRLGQCLNNLLSNAIKFTDRGKVTLEIELDQKQDALPRLRFTVTDTGIGISPEMQAKICKPFTQADASTARRFGGTGLGLAIVKELASGLGGTLQIDSVIGEGSRFTISIPAGVELPPPEVPPLRGDVLVISSEEATKSSAIEYLEREGWHTQLIGSPDDLPDKLFPQLGLIVLDAVAAEPGVTARHLDVLPRSMPLLVLVDTSLHSSLLSELQQRPLTEALSTPVTLSSIRAALSKLGLFDRELKDEDTIGQVPQEFSGVHLMLAEDSVVNQVLMLDLLERAGIRTTLATTGHEVIDLMHSLPEQPDAILMDIQMPDMDGLEATRLLRADSYNLPIIVLSAGISQAERASCLEAGASDFLAKPIEMDELWGTLTRWIKPRDISSVMETKKQGGRATEKFEGLEAIKKTFIQHHGDDAARMAELFADGKLNEIARIAHSIKGVASNLGGHGLTMLASKIDHAVASGDLQQLSALIQMLGSEFDNFKNSA